MLATEKLEEKQKWLNNNNINALQWVGGPAWTSNKVDFLNISLLMKSIDRIDSTFI